MIVKFKNFVTKHNLFDETDKVLLSVSGGRDSIVLMKLFAQAGFVFGVAHCNYHLRGEESDRDERFVRDVCSKYGITDLHVVEFDTEKYAAQNKISIEMAARDLRYEWYNELCEKEGYTKIATAHHLNDQCETFFINLLRSTGINGIRGIPLKREINNNITGKKCHIIRPLMFLSRKDIDSQVNDNEFVDDYTNFTDKYTRNIIRHNIIPKLDEIQSNFPEILNKSIEQFDCTARLIERVLPSIFPKTTDNNGNTIITLPDNFDEAELQGYLYFMLNGYGFNLSQIKTISQSHKSTGSLFFSDRATLLIDRQRIIVKENTISEHLENSGCILVNDDTKTIDTPIKLEFNKVDIKEIKSLKVGTNIALLDYEKLIFPLEISLPKEGETFMPLGMRKHKKISDFYIDKKVDYFTKCCTFAVRTDGKIAWLTNMRIDERFKVTDDTKIVYKIEKK